MALRRRTRRARRDPKAPHKRAREQQEMFGGMVASKAQLPLFGGERARGGSLAVGDKAWAIVKIPEGKGDKGRSKIDGAAQVRVTRMDGDRVEVEIVKVSSASAVRVGDRIVMSRGEVYSARNLEESKAFRAQIDRFWGPGVYKHDRDRRSTARRDPQKIALARLESELSYARENFRFWARQDQRLTRDEYAQKANAERRVRELETAIAAKRKGNAR